MTSTKLGPNSNAATAAGFTLLEIIVVLAVLGALAATIAPVVFRYVDDANITRAQSDANAIASAINKMYKDTGRWPFYANGTSALAHGASDIDVLTSNATCAAGSCTDSTLPTDGTPGATWGLAVTGVTFDNIGNHLVTNTPLGGTNGYSTTGARAWKGPYIDRVPPLDPWGRSYVVNVVNADPGVAAASQKWVLVVSSGPDGDLDTPATTALAANATPTGDDIIARVR